MDVNDADALADFEDVINALLNEGLVGSYLQTPATCAMSVEFHWAMNNSHFFGVPSPATKRFETSMDNDFVFVLNAEIYLLQFINPATLNNPYFLMCR